MGTPQCRPWRSISYQATPAGPARPAGGKTLNKPHSKAGTVMENQPARLHQHDTEPLWAGRCSCAIGVAAAILTPFQFDALLVMLWMRKHPGCSVGEDED